MLNSCDVKLNFIYVRDIFSRDLPEPRRREIRYKMMAKKSCFTVYHRLYVIAILVLVLVLRLILNEIIWMKLPTLSLLLPEANKVRTRDFHSSLFLDIFSVSPHVKFMSTSFFDSSPPFCSLLASHFPSSVHLSAILVMSFVAFFNTRPINLHIYFLSTVLTSVVLLFCVDFCWKLLLAKISRSF